MDKICENCENLEKCRNYEEKTTPCPANPQHGREPDKCEICKGAKGGVLGNENIIGGVIMCDYCHAEMMENKVKSLAQYLGEYLEYEMIDNSDCDTWVALLEQALDAYQSTENVMIKIERI